MRASGATNGARGDGSVGPTAARAAKAQALYRAAARRRRLIASARSALAYAGGLLALAGLLTPLVLLATGG